MATPPHTHTFMLFLYSEFWSPRKKSPHFPFIVSLMLSSLLFLLWATLLLDVLGSVWNGKERSARVIMFLFFSSDFLSSSFSLGTQHGFSGMPSIHWESFEWKHCYFNQNTEIGNPYPQLGCQETWVLILPLLFPGRAKVTLTSFSPGVPVCKK